MADVRHRTTAGNWFRYLLRFLGLLGLLVGAFGLVFYYSSNALPEADTFNSLRASVENAVKNPSIDGVMLVVGFAAAAFVVVWLVLELLMGLTLVTGRRAAVGGNNYVQIGLAAALFLVVNAISFRHYARFDCTRDSQFTLPENLVNELRTLSSESPTDVVVLQLHKSAISRGEEPDNIDKAAELKVVEKVNDLVEQLRELGPRFRVTVLDKQDEYYADKIDQLPPALRKALKSVPEDSIFFHANGRVRRMSFADFYRIDKTASRKSEEVATPDGKTETRVRSTNLVLLPQGREEFVQRLLSLEQRTPRIGLVSIHPELSTRENSDELSAAGLRKSLEANGFEVVDIITKKWGRGGPTPAAFTYDEYELDRREAQFNQISQTIQLLNQRLEAVTELGKKAQTEPLKELDRIFGRQIRRSITKEEDRAFLLAILSENVTMYKQAIDELAPELAETEAKLKELQKNEKANEGRRATDIQAKLKAAVSDCDLLIVPRLTSMDLAKGMVIRPTFFAMPKEQAEAIKDFIKSGKPVLACFGPIKLGANNEAEPDDLEKMFTRLGIEFGNQTVLTDKEARAVAERQGEGLGAASELPPLVLDFEKKKDGKNANPIREAFQVAARAVDGKLDLLKSGPRPVYLSASAAAKLPFSATILQTVKESWNEEKPIPDDDNPPKYEPSKLDDPKRGTPDEERRGPFPVGVAIERKVPAEWFDESLIAKQSAASIGAAAGGLGMGASSFKMEPEDFASPAAVAALPTVRLVAFGHGGLFVGKELSPAQEQLLLDTLNWQLHREELLPKDAVGNRWQFPRVEMSEQQKKLWHMGTFLGMPMLCSFMGIVVLMTRKLR